MILPVLQSKRDCGDCGYCCKLFDITRNDGTVKPRNEWCENIDLSDGACCSRYSERWSNCRDFVCLWLGGLIPFELSPMRTKCVVTATQDGKALVVHVDPSHIGNHRKGAMGAYLSGLASQGVGIHVVCGDRRSTLGIAEQEDK